MYMLTEEKTKQDSRTKLVLFKCVHIHIKYRDTYFIYSLCRLALICYKIYIEGNSQLKVHQYQNCHTILALSCDILYVAQHNLGITLEAGQPYE